MKAVAVFHRDHAGHLEETLRAHDAGLPVFLGNPLWTAAQREEALTGVGPARHRCHAPRRALQQR